MPDYRIIVDLSDHMLYLLDGNQVIKGYPVATGKACSRRLQTGSSLLLTNNLIQVGHLACSGWDCLLPIMGYTEPMSLGLLANLSPMVVYACTTRMYWICLPRYL